MANKENISINRKEFNELKLKLSEAYKSGYRAGLENGFRHGIEIVIQTMTNLNSNEIITKWCDGVIEQGEKNND